MGPCKWSVDGWMGERYNFAANCNGRNTLQIKWTDDAAHIICKYEQGKVSRATQQTEIGRSVGQSVDTSRQSLKILDKTRNIQNNVVVVVVVQTRPDQTRRV